MAGYIGNRAAFLSSTSGADIDGNVTIDGDLTVSGNTVTIDSAQAQEIRLGDNDKMTFGDATGGDLQIYHDGNHSHIKDVGTGNFELSSNGDGFYFRDGSSNYLLTLSNGGPAQLYHNGSAKLATTSTGIDVSGSITADGLTVDGNISLTGNGTGSRYAALLSETSTYAGRYVLQAGGGSSGFGGGLVMYGHSHATNAGDVVAGISTGSNGSFRVNKYGIDGGGDILKADENGDISFYEDTGTTAKFFWDASAERLGIGTSSPSQKLHLGGTAPMDSIIRQDSTVSGTNWEIGERAAGKWQIWEDDGDSVVATFQSNGNVGIGTSSPSYKLHTLLGAGESNGVGFLNTNGQGLNFYTDTTASNADVFIDQGASSAAMAFKQAGTERMRIDSSGNVVIGATSTSYKFDVNGDARVRDRLSVIKPSTGTTKNLMQRWLHSGENTLDVNMYGGSTDLVQFAATNSEQNISIVTDSSANINATNTNGIYIKSGGNVGIGTTSPTYKLHVDGEVQVPAYINYGSGNEYGSGFQINGNKLIHVHASSSGGQSNQHHGSGVWLNGSLVFNCGRSWGLVVVSGGGSNKGKILHSQTYDVYATGTNATSMVNDMATYHTNGNILIVITNDEPDNNGSAIRTTLESTYGAKYAGGVKNSRYAYAYAWRHGRGTLGEQHSMYVAGTTWTASGYNNSRSIASITFTALV